MKNPRSKLPPKIFVKTADKASREKIVEQLLKMDSIIGPTVDSWFEMTDVENFDKDERPQLESFQEDRLKFYELFMEAIDLIEPMIDKLRFDD